MDATVIGPWKFFAGKPVPASAAGCTFDFSARFTEFEVHVFQPSPMWGQDMKSKRLLLLSILLFAVAISGTLLGGMVLAFDKSLWPIDGYVLYIGQYSHVLLVPVSAYALTVCHKEKSSKLQQFTLFVLLVLAIIPLIVIPNSMFVYGIWPS